jgi:hypothetical protein
MKSPHLLVSVLSLFLMVGLARSMPEMRGGPEARLAPGPLETRLKALLPAGTNVHEAFKGFRDLTEFISAVHVADNLDIPFDQLKQRLTGLRPVTLARAIEQLRPSVDASAEVRRAHAQARKDQQR